MAQSGYGHEPLRSYPLPPTFSNQPYPPYATSPHSSSTLRRPDGETTISPYTQKRNRTMIPGLGLGVTNCSFDWSDQNIGTHPQGGTVPSFATNAAALRPAGGSIVTLAPERQNLAKENQGRCSSDEMTEEGQISEGELEDIYEPTPGIKSNEPQARERSGSYSPYLSPREISQHRLSRSPSKTRGNLSSQARSGINPLDTPPQPADNATHQASKPLSDLTVAEARKQAQDAILRLWPLNVRHQHYLDEGIDHGLLDSLFKDLGFDTSSKTSPKTITTITTITPGTKGSVKPSIASDKGETALEQSKGGEADTAQIVEVVEAVKAVNQTPRKQDKSEERKDRIARLLAAKTSKPNDATSSQPPASAISGAESIKPAAQALSHSEKSKLLHLKMEALRKSREARGQKRPHPEEPVAPTASDTATTDAAQSIPINDAAASAKETENSHVLPREKSENDPSVNGQTATSIPGLFLSSTPQPSPAQHSTSGRHSAPANIEMDPRPFKRPFAQARETRPFLIDVSDDEDDTEMDIDSPEQNTSSILRQATPSLQSASFKGAQPFANNGVLGQYTSPALTPSGSSIDSATKDDLENMNKKIEAMKRKIAEAEARKKAKLSRPASPASTPLYPVEADSSEVTVGASDDALPPPMSATSSSQSASELSPSGLSNVTDIQHQLQDLKSQNLSRAASQRLPLLEARRREQQLKLQLLQTQMASIEKEIQESLQEEERLKEDVSSAGPEEGEIQALDEAPVVPEDSESFSPADAMDTSTTSSDSSEDMDQSRISTPGPLAQESFEDPAALLSPSLEQVKSGASLESKETVEPMPVSASLETVVTNLESAVAALDEAEDVAMEEVTSNDGDLEDASDSYEPPEADSSSSSSTRSRASSPFSPAPAEQHVDESTRTEAPEASTAVAAAQPSSASQEEGASAGRREDEPTQAAPVSSGTQSSFTSYKTPLQYFHAYRFHPEFSQTVAGGLRSLTFSNKIDVEKALCPDELAGQGCPRGKQCEYQHFETMQAPDDQILLQLGAYGNGDEKLKQQYNTGLRRLLISFRSDKVKDFGAISQGIIEYRAKFLGDKSKILPLGNVTI